MKLVLTSVQNCKSSPSQRHAHPLGTASLNVNVGILPLTSAVSAGDTLAGRLTQASQEPALLPAGLAGSFLAVAAGPEEDAEGSSSAPSLSSGGATIRP